MRRLAAARRTSRLAAADDARAYIVMEYVQAGSLDRSCVAEIPDHADDLAIISAVVAMAKTLQLSVLAEGVENDQQRQVLYAQGCQELQGYLFSYPLPADEIQRLLFDQSPPWQSFATAIE